MARYLIVKVEEDKPNAMSKIRSAIHKVSKDNDINLADFVTNFYIRHPIDFFNPGDALLFKKEYLLTKEEQQTIEDLFEKAMARAKEHHASIQRP